MPVIQARETARKQGLDLVEVAPTATPPVCRILDYGRYKYQQTKREHEARKSQKVSLLRQIRLRPKIGEHDFTAKSKSVRKLLTQGDKVKVTILFRGREITHPELGLRLLHRMSETASDLASTERQPMMEGRQMNIILTPVSTKPKTKEEEAKEVQNAKT